jgi:hypothetical protein
MHFSLIHCRKPYNLPPTALYNLDCLRLSLLERNTSHLGNTITRNYIEKDVRILNSGNDILVVLGFDAVWTSTCMPALRSIMLSPSSGLKMVNVDKYLPTSLHVVKTQSTVLLTAVRTSDLTQFWECFLPFGSESPVF